MSSFDSVYIQIMIYSYIFVFLAYLLHMIIRKRSSKRVQDEIRQRELDKFKEDVRGYDVEVCEYSPKMEKIDALFEKFNEILRDHMAILSSNELNIHNSVDYHLSLEKIEICKQKITTTTHDLISFYCNQHFKSPEKDKMRDYMSEFKKESLKGTYKIDMVDSKKREERDKLFKNEVQFFGYFLHKLKLGLESKDASSEDFLEKAEKLTENIKLQEKLMNRIDAVREENVRLYHLNDECSFYKNILSLNSLMQKTLKILYK